MFNNFLKKGFLLICFFCCSIFAEEEIVQQPKMDQWQTIILSESMMFNQIFEFCKKNNYKFFKIKSFSYENNGVVLSINSECKDENGYVLKGNDNQECKDESSDGLKHNFDCDCSSNGNFVVLCYENQPNDDLVVDVKYYEMMISQMMKKNSEQINENNEQPKDVNSKVVEVTTEEELASQVNESETTVLVDFYSDNCPPCKILSPHLDKFSNNLEGKIKFLKVNVDKSQSLGLKYNIRMLPTMIIFDKKGEEIERKIGPQEILSYINKIEEDLSNN
jgi:thioredoxin 1